MKLINYYVITMLNSLIIITSMFKKIIYFHQNICNLMIPIKKIRILLLKILNHIKNKNTIKIFLIK